MTMEALATGGPQVVNGGANDPFSAQAGDPNAATVQAGGNPQGQGQAGVANQPQSVQVQQNDPSQPAQAAQQQVQNPDGGGASQPKVLTAEEIDVLVQGRIAKATSTLDKRVNTLTKQLEDQTAEVERVRQEAEKEKRQLILDGTPLESERQRLLEAWKNEDAARSLELKQGAVTDLFRNVEGLRLLQLYGKHGVTEEDILDFTGNPTEMEAYVKSLAFDKLASGGASASQAAAAVNQTQQAGAAAQSNAPAGAAAHQDIGAGGGSTNAPQLLTTQGQASMVANIRTLFNDNGPALPWKTQ